MSKTKSIVSGVVWTVIQNVVNILYGLVSVPFLLHYFGKEEYGLIGIAMSVNVYIQLLDMGMTNSNVKFFSEFLARGDSQKVQKLFSVVNLFYLIIGLINSIALIVISFYVGSLFNVTASQAETLKVLIWILAANAIFSWLSSCFDQFLRSQELIDWIKKRLLVIKLIQFIVLLLTIALKFNIETYFALFTFSATLILPLTVFKIRKISPDLHFTAKYDSDIFKLIFPYALSIFSFSIFQFTASNFRPLFLGNLSGPASVSEYQIIGTIASVVGIFTSAFTQVLLPIVTKMHVANDKDGLQFIAEKGTKYVNIIISVVVFSIILSSCDILTVYVGQEYSDLTFWVVIWMLSLLLGHRNVMTALVFTQKDLKPVSYMGACAMACALVLYVVLIPKIGVGGVIIGYAVHEIIHTIFYYVYFLPKRLHIKTGQIFIKSVFPTWLLYAIATSFVYYLFSSLHLTSLTMIIIRTVMFGFVIIPISLYCVLGREDRHFLMSTICSIKNKKR